MELVIPHLQMIPYEFAAERFSRWMAYVLRHNPERYGLQIDRHGYVDFEEFRRVACGRYPSLTPERLRELITASAGAERFEIAQGRIRARYGHSIPVEPPGPAVEPPAQLYHGIAAGSAETVRTAGLKPTDRRLLHLSETAEEALAVAQRKIEQPVIARVLAREAHEAGVVFFRESKVFLVAQVPAPFVRIGQPQASPTGPAAA